MKANTYEVVFQKLTEMLDEDKQDEILILEPSALELDEIEELRRFSAELHEPEPISLTSTI